MQQAAATLARLRFKADYIGSMSFANGLCSSNAAHLPVSAGSAIAGGGKIPPRHRQKTIFSVTNGAFRIGRGARRLYNDKGFCALLLAWLHGARADHC